MRRLCTLLSFMAALASFGAPPADAAERRKVIIDQDAFEAVNLQSILMLLQDPSVEVLGITTESGDGWAPEETAQTLRMLELVGRTDIPVAQGAIYPLVNTQARNKLREAAYSPMPYKGAWMESWPSYNTIKRRETHAPDVVPPLDEGMPSIKPDPRSAAQFMIDMTRKYPGQVTILALGPLTNIGLAQRLDDGFAGRVQELISEGGILLPPEIDRPADQFAMQAIYAPRMSINHFWDPEATRIVFTSPWRQLTLVTNDASRQNLADAGLLAQATKSGKPVARYVAKMSQPGYPLWDETAVAVWLDPSIATRQTRLAMDVDLMPGASYGALLTWAAGKGPHLGERDVRVVVGVDEARVRAKFVRAYRQIIVRRIIQAGA
ncbi:nucleoside hydrolase [Sphingomonas sp. MMS24-J13]|uniref:nucleoside hydrolase n=1 Tax=Sphingomonas sp. MMS24-J13 TaxID=3238686 RepID=UPI00384ABE52